MLDHRYGPPWWQTAICLPDDWQKTLVGKEGSLLYDWPGKYSGFAVRITPGLAGRTEWVKQELVSPWVPIVRTTKRVDNIEMIEEAFALAPPLPPRQAKPNLGLVVERLGLPTSQMRWAAPPAGTDPAFANVAIGWREPVRYRFKAGKDERFVVVFGLCEGHHPEPGRRILELQVEGKTRRTIDPVAEKGRNVPLLVEFTAQDENKDGWVDLAVCAAATSPDRNTILNLLWVFRDKDLPALERLLAGQNGEAALSHIDCGADDMSLNQSPRHDLILVHLQNLEDRETTVVPRLTIHAEGPITRDPERKRVQIGPSTTLFFSHTVETIKSNENQLVLSFMPLSVAAGGGKAFAYCVARGHDAEQFALDVVRAEAERRAAERYWQTLDLPYGHLEVPDVAVQVQLDSAIRNIYQAREIKNGLPAFQVGPTCYRGLWVVDGAFLLEAITFLGRVQEARNGVKYLLSFQREDGSFMLLDGHWKETGIALWAVTRHARLTNDKDWLRENWAAVERGFAFIEKMRQMPPADAPNAGLVPDGFSDGGLSGKMPEYTNIYWTMVGMRAAVEAARWLEHKEQAKDWQRVYDDFLAGFRQAARGGLRTDSRGNRYLPIPMRFDEKVSPQKAQWAFLHAVFPGQVFAPDDPLVQGNMAMLQAVENQDLVLDTGWLKDGIWTYFASFYGHAWLWLGQGQKAARILYAFGNHASPLVVWREEQKPVGQGNQVVGDMPHDWASAEFIRLTRDLLLLERGEELHLFEGFPAEWARPGAATRVRDVLTVFGPVSLEFKVAEDGSVGTLQLTPPRRNPPERVVLHLDGWSGKTGTMLLSGPGPVQIPLSR